MANKKGIFYSCLNCGPGIDCIQEHWANGDDSPFRIRFIKHIHGIAMAHKDEVLLKDRPDGYIDIYNFCSKCNSLTRSHPMKPLDFEQYDEQ